MCQNLIKNPSFEEFINCPSQLGNFKDDVVNWTSPTLGSTDYFNGCSTAMGTPKNFNGTQLADFGKGYAGLYLYAPDDYREYLQAELTQALVKGKKYRISFYVSLAERSDYAVKEFGVLFSEDKLEFRIKKELSKMHLYKVKDNKYHFLEIGYSNFYSDTQDWILVSTLFEAKGNENFMTIGNFKNNKRTRLFKTKKNAKQGAYYYVDMVLLEGNERVDTDKMPDRDSDNRDSISYTIDKTHIFKNVLFNFDKFQLLETAKQEMQRIYNYVQTDDSFQISISGHTDSIGSTIYNKSLSLKRAQAVANYLEQLGLSKERISWQGHGGTKPIAENRTKDGRQQNRRVEFVISQKSHKLNKSNSRNNL